MNNKDYSGNTTIKFKQHRIVVINNFAIVEFISSFLLHFDKLRLTDLTNDSKVIFAYSPYRSSFKNDILSNLRKGISTLIQEYSEYKYGCQNKHRLLDQLTIQKKILIYNIEEEAS